MFSIDLFNRFAKNKMGFKLTCLAYPKRACSFFLFFAVQKDTIQVVFQMSHIIGDQELEG